MLISKENNVVTLINLFDVEPDQQQELIKTWLEVSEGVENEPGFIGAALHKSRDGRRVLNYAQWDTSSEWENFVKKFEREFDRFNPIASRIDPHLYEVVTILTREA